jgi:hypothetical protein
MKRTHILIIAMRTIFVGFLIRRHILPERLLALNVRSRLVHLTETKLYFLAQERHLHRPL